MSRRSVAFFACTVLAWVVVHTAWVCDDAYITLRTIDNFVNGFGLRWNVVERVQGFTHPAWLLVITPFYALTREAYFTTLAIQGALSLATMFLLCRVVAVTWGHACFAAGVFLSSKALIDYSTAGLENPLSHLLLVLLALALRGAASEAGMRRLAGIFALATLVTLSRQDLAVLVLPALWPWLRLRNWRPILLGATPAIVWSAFSLIYYGQLVPNTALAKLSTGIAWQELVTQGLWYWVATARIDPVTPVILVLGIFPLLLSSESHARRMAIGAAAYATYLIWVGGDFMSGRFLTAPLVWVLIGLAGLRTSSFAWSTALWPATAGAVVIVAGLVGTETPPLLSGPAFGATRLSDEEFAFHGVTDERRFYFPSMGLLHRWGQVDPTPANDLARFGVLTRARAAQSATPEVMQASMVGLFGYWAGPRVHIVDRYGLTDPVLARLPALPGWRIGHFERKVPDGYLESRRTGLNMLTDPSIRKLYDLVVLQTQGSLLSVDRAQAVLKLQTGNWR